MEIRGYEVLAEVSRRPGHVLYRGARVEDRTAVLLKAPGSDPPSAGDVESLESEYAILKELTLPGIPGALDLLRESRRRGQDSRPPSQHAQKPDEETRSRPPKPERFLAAFPR